MEIIRHTNDNIFNMVEWVFKPRSNEFTSTEVTMKLRIDLS
jgi:hypothetical protein